jgi:hypothetical protein
MRKSYEEIVALQQQMNRTTFQRLLDLGLSADKELQLEFSFICDDEQAGRQLLAFLSRDTDYDVKIASSHGVWLVEGTTQPTPVSLEIIDQWVRWMAAAGLKHRCEFDGWGTSIE